MIKTVDILSIKLNGFKIGRLALNSKYLTVFEYDKTWLENGFSISPIYLPLEPKTFVAKPSPFNGLFGVFNDSLPDGWGNLLLDRLLRERGIDPSILSVLDRLSIVGKNGLGALSYEPEVILKGESNNFDLEYFAKEASKILQSKASADVETLYHFNESSGGARPKVIINFEGEDWMVKFPSSYDPENIGEIEYNCSLLAKKSGIEMSETKLFAGKYFGVKLFDRDKNQRFHIHSASGILYADHRIPSLDYDDLLKLTKFITQDYAELEKVFRLMIFNIIIGNKDDHSKNFSYIYKNDKWRLSPAYDLSPNNGFNGFHSTTVLGKANPELKDIVELGKRHGIKPTATKTIFDAIMGLQKTEM
ncbi:MAG: type II toxin-antitoxin system HipA family toxin [Bacteroidales bacterium]|nr:type II toxin-antitoxin system HipA family toxin [Bacteroidales bacterium]